MERAPIDAHPDKLRWGAGFGLGSELLASTRSRDSSRRRNRLRATATFRDNAAIEHAALANCWAARGERARLDTC